MVDSGQFRNRRFARELASAATHVPRAAHALPKPRNGDARGWPEVRHTREAGA